MPRDWIFWFALLSLATLADSKVFKKSQSGNLPSQAELKEVWMQRHDSREALGTLLSSMQPTRLPGASVRPGCGVSTRAGNKHSNKHHVRQSLITAISAEAVILLARKLVHRFSLSARLSHLAKNTWKRSLSVVQRIGRSCQSSVRRVLPMNVSRMLSVVGNATRALAVDRARRIIVAALSVSGFYTAFVTPLLLRLLFHSLCFTPCFLGPSAKRIIQTMDRNVVGVDVTAQSIRVNPFIGKVKLTDFRMHNPKGYQSVDMLKIDKFTIDLNMRKLLFSLVRSKLSGSPMLVEVQAFKLKGCQAFVEKRFFRKSNFHEVLDFMESKANNKKAMTKETAETAPCVTVDKLVIRDVDVRFQIEERMFGKGMQQGFDLAIANIPDYHPVGRLVATDVVPLVFKSLLKSIVTSIAGKRVGRHVF